MKTRLIPLIFIMYSASLYGQANTWSVKFTDAILSRYQPTINNMTSKGWEYSNAIVLLGVQKAYENVGTASYKSYIQSYVDAYVNSSGTISQTINSLDRLHPAILCLFLYEQTGSLKYKTAATFSRNLLVGASSTYPKTTNGIYWHKNNGSYDNIVMLDGMYMAHPFLAKYGSMFNDAAAIDTAVNQILFAYTQLYKSSNKLVLHAWNSTKVEPWANATTGNSSEVWSRALGWYVMALVDVLKYVPTSHPKYNNLITALGNIADGIKNSQDAGTGLWYQVMDRGTSLSGNYLETSGSAMFIYALKTAINNGWISSATYLPVAQSGWTGLQTKIDNYTDGKPRINSFAPAMSVQTSAANYVQASLQGVSSPTSSGTQHPHGYAAVLMAASVMEFNATLPVHFYGFTAKQYKGTVELSWKNGDDSHVLYYEIQRSTNQSQFTTIGKVDADGSGIYEWTDRETTGNTSSYRIKATSTDVDVVYSSIVVIKGSTDESNFQILPNPIVNGKAQIMISGLMPGKYEMTMFGYDGKTSFKKAIQILKEELTLAFPININVSKGVYLLQLKGNNMIVNKKMLVY